MERLFNGYTLHIPEGAFPLSTDTMALSGFVNKTVGNAITCYPVEDCASLEAAIQAVKA